MCCALQKLSNFEEKTVMALCVGMTLVMFTFLKLLRRLPKKIARSYAPVYFCIFEFLGILKKLHCTKFDTQNKSCGAMWHVIRGSMKSVLFGVFCVSPKICEIWEKQLRHYFGAF